MTTEAMTTEAMTTGATEAMTTGATTTGAGMERQLGWALILSAGLTWFSWSLMQLLNNLTIRPAASYYLFGSLERLPGALAAGSCLGALALLSLSPRPGGLWARDWDGRLAVVLAALGAALAAGLGHFVVYHDHALSTDEAMTLFGAATLRHGEPLARLPAAWREYAVAMQPVFTFMAPDSGLWGNPYRPVTAALHALFGLVGGGEKVANAVLTGVAVVLAGAVARRIWPERREAAVLAALLTATSAQVVVTGMTYYAMPAHLAFNLAWLWLFLRGGRLDHVLAAAVGVLAVGLHQITFHALFVIPFLLPLLMRKRWRLALFYAGVYAVAHLFWLFWFETALWWMGADPAQSTATIGGLQFLYNIGNLVRQWDGGVGISLMFLNLLRLFAWQNLALLPLLAIGLAGWRGMPDAVRGCAWGLLLPLPLYLAVLSDQGHGWGFRYLHGHLGALALVAVHGWFRLTDGNAAGAPLVRRTVAMLTAASLVLLAVRAVQVEDFVRPWAGALAYIRSLPDAVVVVDDGDIWYGQDLAQNDPYLTGGPKIMALRYLSSEASGHLAALRPRLIGHDDLVRAGVAPPHWPRPAATGPRPAATGQ